jgi:hypothetical protein
MNTIITVPVCAPSNSTAYCRNTGTTKGSAPFSMKKAPAMPLTTANVRLSNSLSG